MKKLVALVATCLVAFLFYQAYGMQGYTLARFGYIAGAVILISAILVLFIPKRDDEQSF